MKAQRSLLAESLRRLFEATKLTQKEWAKILCVSPSAVSQWLSDKTLPAAKHIRLLLDGVEGVHGQVPAVEFFYEIAEMSAPQVTPHFTRIYKSSPPGCGTNNTLADYLSEDAFRYVYRRIRAEAWSRASLRERDRIRNEIAHALNNILK